MMMTTTTAPNTKPEPDFFSCIPFPVVSFPAVSEYSLRTGFPFCLSVLP